jgi:phosphoenolpyruvate-protein phosphotransferase (PTS system enzyme I)
MAEIVRGVGVCPGFATGPAYILPTAPSEPKTLGSPQEERKAYDAAVVIGAAQLEEIAARLRSQGHESEAGIMDAQCLMVRDPTMLDAVHKRIDAGQPAARAVQEAAADVKAVLEAMEDPYLAARAADVQDVADRIVRALQPELEAPPMQVPCVLVAHDLTPSQTASIDRTLVRGFATDAGSPTSHTAILARALDIPAVVGLGDLTERVQNGQEIALDGETGTVSLNPDTAQREALIRGAAAQAEQKRQLHSLRDEPAQTRDGHRLTLAANIGSPDDVPAAVEAGAEGVGLFRTEFLFAGRDQMPGEDDQVEAYATVLRAMPDHTVVIRTLDVGGDKPLPYVPATREKNPFLGLRGIRYTLANPQVMRSQLRALLRASKYGKLAIMFPMVSELEQIEQARTLVSEARDEVGGEAEIGIMVEVPAAALIAHQLAAHVDFFSAGTNDLAQYVLAVDRINERIAVLYRPLHPAILSILAQTVAGAHDHGRWAGICGEMGGDLLAIPLLVGLGFDELSMTPNRIPAAKERIRSLEFAACRDLVHRARRCSTAAEVEQLVRERF